MKPSCAAAKSLAELLRGDGSFACDPFVAAKSRSNFTAEQQPLCAAGFLGPRIYPMIDLGWLSLFDRDRTHSQASWPMQQLIKFWIWLVHVAQLRLPHIPNCRGLSAQPAFKSCPVCRRPVACKRCPGGEPTVCKITQYERSFCQFGICVWRVNALWKYGGILASLTYGSLRAEKARRFETGGHVFSFLRLHLGTSPVGESSCSPTIGFVGCPIRAAVRFRVRWMPYKGREPA